MTVVSFKWRDLIVVCDVERDSEGFLDYLNWYMEVDSKNVVPAIGVDMLVDDNREAVEELAREAM